MKIALAQINTTVGDFAGNTTRLREACERGAALRAALLWPELA